MKRRLLNSLLHLCLYAVALAGCGRVGNTNAVKEANELAISCQTEAALTLTSRTADETTLAGGLAELQRIVFLRDVGRLAEADRALEARNARVDADAQARAETERAVRESLGQLREERFQRTGQSLCR